MKQGITLNWKDNMAFETEINGHKLTIDATPEVGGNDEGPRPKALMMLALAGCTAMDVISILKKMRVKPEKFSIDIEAELLDDFPKNYTSMKIIYTFKGDDLDKAKIEKAVNLSQDRYCGVSANYREAMKLTHEIKINE